MSDSPYFSVIIPTYNRSHSIVDAVESVIAQSFENFELLIIDDGSTDNTSDLIEPITLADRRVQYIYQENAERSAARNRGIDLAQGKYICFLDSDDLFLNDHLQCFYYEIQRNENPSAILVCNTFLQRNGQMKKQYPFKPDSNNPLELVLKASFSSQQTAIWREILVEYKFNVNLRVGEDQELWFRILEKYPLIRTENYTVVIRDLGDRTIDIRDTKTYLDNLELKKHLIAIDRFKRITPEWRKFILSGAYYKLAVSYLRNKNRLMFYVYLVPSILSSPRPYVKEKLLTGASALPIFGRFVYVSR